MKLKNKIFTSITSLVLVAAFTMFGVAVEAEGKEASIERADLSKLATSNNNNIMLYDYNGNIIDEFHTDGENIHYNYESGTGKLQDLNNSNGKTVKFIYGNNKNI